MMVPSDSTLASFVRERYTPADVAALRSFLEQSGTFKFVPLRSGLYPATPNIELEGGRYAHVWVRDNVYIAHALWRAGRDAEAHAIVGALTTYFDTHAARFEAISANRASAEDPMRRPHVRFDGDALTELTEHWPHAQNDVHGLFLWLTGTMVHENALDLDPALVRVATRTIRFLEALPFYEDADSGCWEEARALRASSVGAVCAGLIMWHEVLHDYDHALSHLAFDLYEQGMRVVTGLLPFEARGVTEREYDAATLFLVTPLRILTGDQAHGVVEHVLSRLIGEHGVKRYERDAFWGPDYDHISPELRTSDASTDDSFRTAYAVAGKEAAWTIFDPLLARYFSERHARTDRDEDAQSAATHLNRALSALVRTDTGALLMPELYYHKGDELVPNTILPLYWAQANLLYALS
jgi:hypothetical protein